MRNRQQQSGQSLTEYLILVALIAISSIGVVRMLGHTTSAQLAKVTNSLHGGNPREVKIQSIKQEHYQKKDFSDFMDSSSKGED